MSGSAIPHHDSLHRLAQIGTTIGVQLVRILSCQSGNTYQAKPVEFKADGGTQLAEDKTLTVTNLAEPSDTQGTTPQDTEAVALDVEGRWVVFVQTQRTGMLVARVSAAMGQGAYTVKEQVLDNEGQWQDKPSAPDLTAWNLAEQSLGSGAAVDIDSRVMISTSRDPSAAGRYVFDHPAYAKYLD